MKLKGEVGMRGPKRIQKRFVGIINAFLDYNIIYIAIIIIIIMHMHMPVDDDSLVLSLTNKNQLILSPSYCYGS